MTREILIYILCNIKNCNIIFNKKININNHYLCYFYDGNKIFKIRFCANFI